jgi:hypothetical protein
VNWQRVYAELVRRAQERSAVCEYSERHHITPKAHGGTNNPENLVRLTAREHFLAHWLLWRIHKDRATALAFRLLCDTTGKPRGRSYAEAKALYATAMLGDANIAKRQEVREKIRTALRANHPYKGKKRPNHAELLRSRGQWAGERNPWFNTGERQLGIKNRMARSVTGIHPSLGTTLWATAQEAAIDIGVSAQAVCQALRRNGSSRGWKLEYVA